MAGNLKICCNNIRGLGDFSKRKSFFQWLKVNTADITLLQEAFITVENEKRIKRDWDGFMINCCSDSAHSRGVSIMTMNDNEIHLFKPNFMYTIDNKYCL